MRRYLRGTAQLAARYGHAECVRLLIEAGIEQSEAEVALVVAERWGRSECSAALKEALGVERD